LTIVSVALDPAGKILQDQPVAADSPLEVQIANSNPAAGNLQQATLRLAGGLRSASTYFHPAAEGDSTIAPVQPAGFATPADRASIVASVAKPALAIAGDIFLGKDLQTPATLVLGEKAPPGGVTVTLTSADSSRLVLSAKEDLLGSGSLKVTVPAGEQSALYFIQALGDSGDVAYSASAPGFRSKSGQVGLTASGFVLASEITLTGRFSFLWPGQRAVRRSSWFSRPTLTARAAGPPTSPSSLFARESARLYY
jgi:hypothetical protein